jgi:hypothetical protein
MILAKETPNGLEKVELPNDEARLQKILALSPGIPEGAIFVAGLEYPVTIRDGRITCGCETRTVAEWTEFSDRDLAAMEGSKAARFWRKRRDAILALANLTS